MPKENYLDKLFDIPKITVTIGGVLFLVSAGAIYLFDRYPDSRKTLEFAVLALTASAGTTSVFYFGRNSRLELNNKKIDRALNFNSRWNELSKVHITGETLKLLNDLENKNAQQQSQIISDTFIQHNQVKQSIISILNFLEELAVAVDNNQVNQNIVFNYYGNIVKRYYSLFSPWINQLRNNRQRQGENWR